MCLGWSYVLKPERTFLSIEPLLGCLSSVNHKYIFSVEKKWLSGIHKDLFMLRINRTRYLVFWDKKIHGIVSFNSTHVLLKWGDILLLLHCWGELEFSGHSSELNLYSYTPLLGAEANKSIGQFLPFNESRIRP